MNRSEVMKQVWANRRWRKAQEAAKKNATVEQIAQAMLDRAAFERVRRTQALISKQEGVA